MTTGDADGVKRGRMLVAPSTRTQGRVVLFEATQRPTARTGEWQTTSWGRVRVSGRLGQRHADVLEAICSCSEKSRVTPDGGVEVLVDPHRVRRVLSGGEGQYSHQRLHSLLADLRAAVIEIETPELSGTGERAIGGLLDHWVPSSATVRDPLHGERQLWRVRLIDPSQIKLQAYDREARSLAIGERIRWSENHKPTDDAPRVRNGSGATVESISPDGRRLTLRTDSGQQIEIDSSSGAKLDHAYAATSYSAQGLTVDAVLIHHNCESGAHGDRETYVSLTRARDDAIFYTQDVSRAASQSGLTLDKSAAHDVTAAPDLSSERPSPPQPTHDHGPEYG